MTDYNASQLYEFYEAFSRVRRLASRWTPIPLEKDEEEFVMTQGLGYSSLDREPWGPMHLERELWCLTPESTIKKRKGPIRYNVLSVREVYNENLRLLIDNLVIIRNFVDWKSLGVASPDELGNLFLEPDGTCIYLEEYSEEAIQRNGILKERLDRFLKKLRERIPKIKQTLITDSSPPRLSARVTIVTGAGLRDSKVIVDRKEYLITSNQAILFRYLVEANGEVVSGPEIAKREEREEFKASRYREQLTQELRSLIERVSNPKSGFKLSLPPLA